MQQVVFIKIRTKHFVGTAQVWERETGRSELLQNEEEATVILSRKAVECRKLVPCILGQLVSSCLYVDILRFKETPSKFGLDTGQNVAKT